MGGNPKSAFKNTLHCQTYVCPVGISMVQSFQPICFLCSPLTSLNRVTTPILSKSYHPIQYTDNLFLNTSTKNISPAGARLSSYLDELYWYLPHWKLDLNSRKCEAIVFRGNMKVPPKIRRNIAVLSLKIHETLTYLEVTIPVLLQEVDQTFLIFGFIFWFDKSPSKIQMPRLVKRNIFPQ